MDPDPRDGLRIVKTSKVKRLIPKNLARRIVAAPDGGQDLLAAYMKRAAADTIEKMRGKGYELLSCLETGEAVFVRDDPVVALHIQLPRDLYTRLDDACRRRGATKRQIVADALNDYLPPVSDE